MAWGMRRIVLMTTLALVLGACSIGAKWAFRNESGQTIALERVKESWFVKPVVVRDGETLKGEVPAIKDNTLRITAGNCLYSYGAPWPGYPASGALFGLKPEWVEQWKKNPTAMVGMVRLEKDFQLHAYHIEPDGSVGEEVLQAGFPIKPQADCKAAPHD